MKKILMSRGLVINFMMLVLTGVSSTLSAQTVTTYAGMGEAGYNGDGRKATNALLNIPVAAVPDGRGNVYVADFNGNRIRKIDAAGNITTIAGTGMSGMSDDGTRATEAAIGQPAGLAVDAQGNIYFSEYAGNRVRKIDSRGIISTVAGVGTGGYTGNGGKAAMALLQGPGALALDKDDNLYIADGDNNCIRKVDHNGIITLFAGSAFGSGTGRGGYSGDGGKAILAKLNQPSGLAFDAAGNLFISDCFNHCVRKVNAQGIITTVAGTATGGYNNEDGKATIAMLKYPGGITIDAAGNLYIADNGNSRIRMVSSNGDIHTVAGNGTQGYSGDGGNAVNAMIGRPTFVSAGKEGELYFGDNTGSRIRKIVPARAEVMTNVMDSKPVGSHVSAANMTGASAGDSIQ